MVSTTADNTLTLSADQVSMPSLTHAVLPFPDMCVENEDKPEQQLARLAEVAEAAPIKHECHAVDANQHAQHPPHQLDTVQVRLAGAGAAEVDPLQNGHPTDLEPPAAGPAAAAPAAPAAASDSAPAGAWGLAPGVYCPQQPQPQPGNAANQAPASSVTKPESNHRHGEISPRVPGVPANEADTFTGMEKVGVGGGHAQVKGEAGLHAAGMGFQVGDANMVNGEQDVDIGAYVKTEALLRQGSGSSGSENGQAVLMDLDAQGRQPSPPANANSASLGEQAHARGRQSCYQLHTTCLQVAASIFKTTMPDVNMSQK